MDTYTDKKGEKGDYIDSDSPTIRIILKSQDVKNLDYVAGKITLAAKEKGFSAKGPRFMPTKTLIITTRLSPCGEGKNII
jgi:small subunit ribosomal protein S20e